MAGNLELKQLMIDLAKISKGVKSELRTGMRKIAAPTLEKVQLKASEHSTRIGPATKMTTGFTQRTAGARIVTDRTKAPHARPFEHGGRQGRFNHPVFAEWYKDRKHWKWVKQQAHPYMWPTVVGDLPDIGERMLDLVIDVALKNGFHR